MRIFLTGTSNSILVNGFRKAFESDSRISKFTNNSFGASGSVAIGQHVGDVDFSEYDFCLIDYFVNQEVFLLKGEARLSDAVEDFLFLVDKCSRSGCQPIVVVFPTSTRFNFRRPYQDAVLSALSKLGVPYFDVYDLINTRLSEQKFPVSSFFLDQMHLKREIALRIGQFLCDWMHANSENASSCRLVEVEGWFRPSTFLTHHEVEAEGFTIQRSSKLASADLLILQQGSKVTLKLPSDFELAGISFNAAKSLGLLKIQDTDQTEFKIPPSGRFQKRDLTMVTIPLASPPSSQDGRMDFEYVLPTEYQQYGADAVLELGGFVVRAKVPPTKAMALISSEGEVSLAKLMPDSVLADIAHAAMTA